MIYSCSALDAICIADNRAMRAKSRESENIDSYSYLAFKIGWNWLLSSSSLPREREKESFEKFRIRGFH